MTFDEKIKMVEQQIVNNKLEDKIILDTFDNDEELEQAYDYFYQNGIEVSLPNFDEEIEDDMKFSSVGDSVKIYMRQIHAIPLLSPEQERYLAERISKGDKAARERLINSNLRLVASIARTFIGKSALPFQDLIQEGNIGLMKAVDKYDYTKGWRFSTYATYWIRQAVSRAIADNAKTIRTPVHVVEALSKISKARNELTQIYGYEPSVQEIANHIGLDVKKVQTYLDAARTPLSIDKPITEDDESDMTDIIADMRSPSPEEALMEKERKASILEVLDALDEREKEVVIMSTGLIDGVRHTLNDVGEALGVTRERARQIESKAMQKLRHPIRAELLRERIRDL